MNTKYWSWRLLIGSYCQSESTQFLVKILQEELIIEFDLEIFERNRKRWYVQSSLTPRGPVCSFLLFFIFLQDLDYHVRYVMPQLLTCSCFMLSGTLFACTNPSVSTNMKMVFVTAASVLIRKLLFSFCLHNGNNILNLPRTSSVSAPASRFCHPSGASQKR